MQLRGIMIIVLVACLLLGWVRSQEASTTTNQRSRRPHLKRRVLERLQERGLSEAEREAVAEEILARLESLSPTISTTTTTTTTTTIPPHPQHHYSNNHHRVTSLSPSLEIAASSLIDERPSFQEILSEVGPFPDLGVLEELQERQREEDLEEYQEQEELQKEVTKAVMHQYLFTEVQLEELLRGKRGDEMMQPLVEGDSTTAPEERSSRRRKSRRNLRREDKERRREGLKNRRRKKKKLSREVRRMIDGGDITLIEEEESGEHYIDCCPSKLEFVNKTVGKTDSFRAVEIHPGYPYFRERVCLPQFVNQECIFPVRSLRPHVVTRCVQQYSYSQALSRTYHSSEEWKINFIRLRSGCSCQVSVNHKKKRRRKRKR